MTGGIRTEVAASLDQFSQQEWDGLLPGSAFYGSYSWQRAVRRHEAFSVRYVAARDESGQLLAALPLYTAATAPRERQFDPATIFGTAGDGDFYPAAVVGVRAGYSTHFPFRPEPGTRPDGATMAALLERCQQEARGAAARGLSLLYLPQDVLARVTGVLQGAARVIPAGADAVLRVNWRSFDEYQDGWPRNRRRGIARDIAAFRDSGCVLSRGRFADHYGEMAPLLASLQARYGALDSVPIIHQRLAEQAQILDDHAVCFFCWKRSAMVAFALFYEWESELYARVVGFDYEALPEDSRAYFSILFYEPIRFAIANKFRAIHYGRGTTEAKVRRGAILEPRWSVYIDLRKGNGDE
jgi:uncharacterized protein